MASPAPRPTNFDLTVQRLSPRAGKEQLALLAAIAAVTSLEIVLKLAGPPSGEAGSTFQLPHPLPPWFKQFLDEAAVVCAVSRLLPHGMPQPDGTVAQARISQACE